MGTSILTVKTGRYQGLEIKSGEVAGFLQGKIPENIFNSVLALTRKEMESVSLSDEIGRCEETISWRKKVGVCSQDRGLLSNLTLFENVDLPVNHHEKGQEETVLALEEVGIPRSYWGKRPHQVDERIRQYTLLARSVALKPRLLLINKPTRYISHHEFPFLYFWIKKQQAKGMAILIGSWNYPFMLSVCDWYIDPETQEKSTFPSFGVGQQWEESLKFLKEDIKHYKEPDHAT